MDLNGYEQTGVGSVITVCLAMIVYYCKTKLQHSKTKCSSFCCSFEVEALKQTIRDTVIDVHELQTKRLATMFDANSLSIKENGQEKGMVGNGIEFDDIRVEHRDDRHKSSARLRPIPFVIE